jgi:catechol 2,3-dioxygenase-like lactoylglutathione lyase family enzyme
MAVVSGALHSHTTLECLNIDETLRFYHEALGLSTAHHLAKAGLFCSTNRHITATIELPKISAQPYWNYHALAAPAGRIDAIHAALERVRDDYGIREVHAPATETRFGIATYGFAVCDRNGNWWRIEDADGPFGNAALTEGDSTSIVPPGPVSYVTLEVRDVDATFAFYRDVLGLDVALRDGAIHYAGGAGVNLIAVPAAGDVLPQPVLNHHGLTLPENQHDAVRALQLDLKARSGDYGLTKVMGASSQHGSFSFYFQDRDTNWWEIETLEGGLDPWQRATLPDGDTRLLEAARGASTVRDHGARVTA